MHLGIQELVVILIIVLVLFGGKKISGLGKALGTSMREFKEEVNKKDSASDGDGEKSGSVTEDKDAQK
ncbi:twin-arginine translocase TatA/TatE family subunit [Anaeroglobus geminatus]|mgnify:FL=1|jgi:sec-independent protein translocase protein TatA|uniref:Sec-independent protein translocase protein TatA n=1 Tax=Anaeroglobus geminatus F0357 TaxID=861450 RepID=G9YHV0_9FIRM|nr:twin-arginine translocase TatA/TatE family subunit [Anaeroglobus geminatus]EHM40380.1 twin arginine-targeting protein translocase, TatA/E family [Anaeroglobus geminatus F0357]